MYDALPQRAFVLTPSGIADFVSSVRIFHCVCRTLLQMAMVIRGEYRHVVSKHYIIDCRYPYEYESGHIQVQHLRCMQIVCLF